MPEATTAAVGGTLKRRVLGRGWRSRRRTPSSIAHLPSPAKQLPSRPGRPHTDYTSWLHNGFRSRPVAHARLPLPQDGLHDGARNVASVRFAVKLVQRADRARVFTGKPRTLGRTHVCALVPKQTRAAGMQRAQTGPRSSLFVGSPMRRRFLVNPVVLLPRHAAPPQHLPSWARSVQAT